VCFLTCYSNFCYHFHKPLYFLGILLYWVPPSFFNKLKHARIVLLLFCSFMSYNIRSYNTKRFLLSKYFSMINRHNKKRTISPPVKICNPADPRGLLFSSIEHQKIYLSYFHKIIHEKRMFFSGRHDLLLL
jgi:hypothetical protein